MTTFQQAVKTFEDDADWLGAADQPALVALRAMAAELDEGELKPAMLAQFGLAYRSLLKRAPGAGDGPADPLEQALAEAEGK